MIIKTSFNPKPKSKNNKTMIWWSKKFVNPTLFKELGIQMANRIVTPRSNVKNVNNAHVSVTLEYSFISTDPKW